MGFLILLISNLGVLFVRKIQNTVFLSQDKIGNSVSNEWFSERQMSDLSYEMADAIFGVNWIAGYSTNFLTNRFPITEEDYGELIKNFTNRQWKLL